VRKEERLHHRLLHLPQVVVQQEEVMRPATRGSSLNAIALLQLHRLGCLRISKGDHRKKQSVYGLHCSDVRMKMM
jgi:hypothetical protein